MKAFSIKRHFRLVNSDIPNQLNRCKKNGYHNFTLSAHSVLSLTIYFFIINLHVAPAHILQCIQIQYKITFGCKTL